MDSYTVRPLKIRDISVRVPASKSILNRALLLAAFTDGDIFLSCGSFGDDTRALIGCLGALGIRIEEVRDGLLVHGTRSAARNATLDVQSAGTAARFLTAILAFRGGEYELHASVQMERRPMEILPVLCRLGARIDYLKEEGHFPFRLVSDGIRCGKAEIGTDVSTQYGSGLMLAAAVCAPFTVELTGSRTAGSYLNMTADVIRSFGGECKKEQNAFTVRPIAAPPARYTVEPDVSGACYFYAVSLLCRARVLVEGVHMNTAQGDVRFLRLLESKGVHITDTERGIVADGRRIPFYNGIDELMTDYSDQTLTAAVLAAFASSPSILRGISHIRSQECDRVAAAIENLNALGAHAFTDGEDIFIEPAPLRPAAIKTYGDHRVAMAFAIGGLKLGGVTIDDPACCSKTFPEFFDLLSELTE